MIVPQPIGAGFDPQFLQPKPTLIKYLLLLLLFLFYVERHGIIATKMTETWCIIQRHYWTSNNIMISINVIITPCRFSLYNESPASSSDTREVGGSRGALGTRSRPTYPGMDSLRGAPWHWRSGGEQDSVATPAESFIYVLIPSVSLHPYIYLDTTYICQVTENDNNTCSHTQTCKVHHRADNLLYIVDFPICCNFSAWSLYHALLVFVGWDCKRCYGSVCK